MQQYIPQTSLKENSEMGCKKTKMTRCKCTIYELDGVSLWKKRNNCRI